MNFWFEECIIDVLLVEEFFVILSDGCMVLVIFRIDGCIVFGFDVKLFFLEIGGFFILGCVLIFLRIGKSVMFVGSEEGDFFVFGWIKK